MANDKCRAESISVALLQDPELLEMFRSLLEARDEETRDAELNRTEEDEETNDFLDYDNSAYSYFGDENSQ